MIYMVIGVTFLIIFGFDLAYEALWLGPVDGDDLELEGHPVKFNKSGALIPVVMLTITYCWLFLTVKFVVLFFRRKY